MKLRTTALGVLVSIGLTSLSAIPAGATMLQNLTSSANTANALGLIIKYRAGFEPVAPNGDITGENTANVNLTNPDSLGGGFVSADFADNLSAAQITAAKQNLLQDPRVESVDFNMPLDTNVFKQPSIASQILVKNKFVELPIFIKSALRAAAPTASAVDAWSSANPTLERVRLSWSKPAITGTLLGFRLRVYFSGAWRTWKSLTSATARSYTANSVYFRAGTNSSVQVAAITRSGGVTYVGTYRTVYVTPTTTPKFNSSQLVLGTQSGLLRASWTNVASSYLAGGLPVTYAPVLKDPSNQVITCTTTSANSCTYPATVSQQWQNFTLSVGVTNSRGTTAMTPLVKPFITRESVDTTAAGFNPDYATKQWNLKNATGGINAVDAWDTETGDPGIVVAVIDTGITQHSDIPLSSLVGGYDLRTNTEGGWDLGDYCEASDTSCQDPANPSPTFIPSSWHGTHVAGIIAAANNSEGTVGIAPYVKIEPIRVLASDGTDSATIIKGLHYAIGDAVSVGNQTVTNANPANVINMSIGGSSLCDTATENVLATAKSRGITVVTAAGNENAPAAGSYPGNCFPTINVASTGPSAKPADYSNYGSAVDIAAPGGDDCVIGQAGAIYSTLNTGLRSPVAETYGYEQGTSMASPTVAAVVALMYSVSLRANSSVVFDGNYVTNIYNTLASTATPMASATQTSHCHDMGHTYVVGTGFGAGIVNAKAAVEAMRLP